MRTYESLPALIQELEGDAAEIERVLVRNRTREVREILRFRHRLRNLYGEDLDPKKTQTVQETVELFFADFPALHARFVDKLRSISDVL